MSTERWMVKDVACIYTYTHNGTLDIKTWKWNIAICDTMYAPRGYYAKWN